MIKYLIGAVLLLGALYGVTRAWPLLAGPALSIDSPVDFASFADGIIPISGRAARAARFTIDGAPVLHEEDGTFVTTLTFPKGSSILTFVATDRFGRTVTARRTIFVPAGTSSPLK